MLIQSSVGRLVDNNLINEHLVQSQSYIVEELTVALNANYELVVSDQYSDVVTYKLIGEIPIPTEYGLYSYTILRRIKRNVTKYVLSKDLTRRPILGRVERDRRILRYLLPYQVDKMLE